MLNDNEMPSSGEKIFIRKPDNDFLNSYQWSLDMFRISLTVSSYSTKIDLIATETPLNGNCTFIRKLNPDSVLVVC
jgi:hypothetical protein